MANDDFSITLKESTEGVKFIVQGRLDYTNADKLQFQLDETFKNGINNIILNMHLVEYLSSTGIRVILKAYKDLKEAGGKLGIEQPSERVRNVLGLVALDQMLIQ